MNSRRVLLVEGYHDSFFARGLLNQTGIQGVDVYPPKDLGATGNGASQVVQLLPVLLAKIQSGDFDQFAVLVDADHHAAGEGFAKRIGEIGALLHRAGYVQQAGQPGVLGQTFTHPKLIPVHVAILPNHASDGMVEDLLSQCVSAGQQQQLLVHAQNCIAGLPSTLFSVQLHASKAVIATLLAWQRRPGCDAGIAIRQGVFNITAPPLQMVVQWLRNAFP